MIFSEDEVWLRWMKHGRTGRSTERRDVHLRYGGEGRLTSCAGRGKKPECSTWFLERKVISVGGSDLLTRNFSAATVRVFLGAELQ
jgi:hypothetical protein